MSRARSWLLDIFAHNHAEQLRINREVQRQKLGVTQQDYPYPGAIQGSGNPTTINQGGGWLKGAILGAVLLAGGGAAALGLKALTPPATPSVPAPVSPPAVTPAAPKAPGWDAIYEVQQPDGTWKQTKRERITP